MLEILNLIFGLFLSLILVLIYLLSCIMDGEGPKNRRNGKKDISGALDFMSGILGGAAIDKDADTSTIDFPIDDPDLKDKFTKAFWNARENGSISPLEKFSELKCRLPYTESQKIYTGARHIGQRKLILNEIQFLTRIDPKHRAVVVYVGAAPSNKGAFLASLFPNVRFVLIDPAKFDIRPYSNVRIANAHAVAGVGTGTKDSDLEEGTVDARDLVGRILRELEGAEICTIRTYMTAAIADEFNRRFSNSSGKVHSPWGSDGANNWTDITDCPLYFMSDIRTNFDPTDQGPTTFDIVWNSAQQMDWIYRMKPARSMLKFRIPFFGESGETLQKFADVDSHHPAAAESFDSKLNNVDFRQIFRDKKFQFLDGELFLQPWAPIESTETRLIVEPQEGEYKIREYKLKDYENAFYCFNKITRNYQMFDNPSADWELGFDHCADCALENKIWTDYCERYVAGYSTRTIHKFVNTLSQLTFRKLRDQGHGRMFKPIPLEILERKFREYKGGDSNDARSK